VNAQRLAAGREDLKIRTALQQSHRKRRARIEQVLAVIEQQ
jgi:hypothetical protein